MGLFGKKKGKSRDEIIAEGKAEAEAEAAKSEQEKKDDGFDSGNPKVDMEITRIKAQVESFNEIRKANSERFSRISEQMGELRGMIMDTNKTMSKIEVSSTKAIDLVESVKPEKLMIEIRKQEGKTEALKANIESNEAMMKDLMEELKKMRKQMNFYKGIEQVANLNEEVKQEILDIKKVEANIERHADKAESIFLDMEKKFADFEKFESIIKDMQKGFQDIQSKFDKLKLEVSKKSDKKEFGKLTDKFSEFEKHTGNILKLLDKRSKHMKEEMKDMLKKIKKQLKDKHNIILDEKDIDDETLPDKEKEYIDKAQKGDSKDQDKPESNKKSEDSKSGDSEDSDKSEKSAEKPDESKENEKENKKKNKDQGKGKDKDDEKEEGLKGILKKRKIIKKKLDDEGSDEDEAGKSDDKEENSDEADNDSDGGSDDKSEDKKEKGDQKKDDKSGG